MQKQFIKSFIYAFVLLGVLSCNNSKQIPELKKNNPNATIIKPVKVPDYLKRLEPTNGRFVLDDIIYDFCLVFGVDSTETKTSWEDMTIDSLTGYIQKPIYKETSKLKELRGQRLHIFPVNDSLPVCKIGKTMLIPFNSHEEIMHLTAWNILPNDTIEFNRVLMPTIERTYSNITSIELKNIGQRNFLSIYLMGGEGGSNWDEQIIAELFIDYTFSIIKSETVGYCHDCGNWGKISVLTRADGFEFIETIDSMRLINDGWERVNRQTKSLGIIDIKK